MRTIPFPLSAKLALASVLVGATLNVQSATTDLATAPLVTSPTSSVLPNIFLMMDDSGSMGWDYMPDNAGNFNSPAYGGASGHCNGVFYDPALSYSAPNTSTGTFYPDASFTGAWTDGYDTGAGTVDLSTSFVPSGGGTAGPAYYYKYIGTQTTEALKNYYDSSSTFYTECNTSASSASIRVTAASNAVVNSVTVSGTAGGELLSAATASSSTFSTVASRIAANINACTAAITGNCTVAGYHATIDSTNSDRVFIWPPSNASAGATLAATVSSGSWTRTLVNMPASPKFLRVKVSSTSGPSASDERTNFANWYSYYRTRMLMMKTATGTAFNSIGSTFRVGLATMNNNTGSDFLALNTFDAAQKAAWYAKLYGTTVGSSTPLRQALATAGKMYAMKLPSNQLNGQTVVDPIQYSCQQNFTILTTDGFWNASATSSACSNSTNCALAEKLTAGNIGNQDYFETRPMYDGSNVVQTVTTPYTTVQQRKEVNSGSTTTKTVQWSVAQLVDASGTHQSTPVSCSVAATTPSNTISAYMLDNNHKMALGLNSSSPDPTRCILLGGSGGGTAWFCRGSGSNNPAVSASTVTDSTGKIWYLVGDTSGNSGCTTNFTAWGGSYSTTKGACPGTTAYTGSYVNTQKWNGVETISGGVTTTYNLYTANQTTTQTITNGVPGVVGPLTPALTYSLTGLDPAYTPNPVTTTTPTDTYAWTAAGNTTVCAASLPTGNQTGTVPPSGATGTLGTSPTVDYVYNMPVLTSSTTAGTTTTTVLSTTTTAGTATTTGTSSGGTYDTLADVAEYYYITDLRTSTLGNNLSGAASPWNGSDVSENNVPSSGLDAASHQHMTTFTLGLGARGRMVFDPNYQTQTGTSFTPSDFFSVKQGSTANGTTTCSWQTSGACNWPTPKENAVDNIDDLWHAAVNGRGTYFSATNPADLSTALSSALAGVSARTGASAAATTSNAFVTQGDNFLFRSTFVTNAWSGELDRQQLDVNTGVVLPTIDWSAQSKLDALASRNIWFYNTASTNNLSSFTYTNLSAAQKAYFGSAAISTLSQLCTNGATNCLPVWTANTTYAVGDEYRVGTTWYRVSTAYTSGATFGAAADTTKTTVVTGAADANLVNFIRGDRSNEGVETANTKYFRQRAHVLGDIVNSESHYVKGAISTYADPGYDTYANSKKTRQSMVYVGANDGMLHAFYATDGMVDTATGLVVTTGGVNVTGGNEAWAYIPSFVMPNLYKLADKQYFKDSNHQYFVDGTPEVGDICVSGCSNALSAVWKTILVGGLNDGGKGYYALDITNPAAPKGLWEFTDANMGYTFGNPKIVKLKNGTWVVLLSSGYNNTGDGSGHLFVVNAYTGGLITDINTGEGVPTTPSGLARIDAPVATPGVDSTAIAAYGGDLLGNVWRFDINGDIGAAGFDAQLLATLKDGAGNAQPITSKPLITLVGTNYVLNIGTGRYLGSSDLADTRQQSFYAMKDPFSTGTTPSVAIYGDPRNEGTFVQQTRTTTSCPPGSSSTVCSAGETVVISSNKSVNFSSNAGWFFDFPLAGERNNTDAALNQGTLVLTTNVPNASSCSVGGDSYLYQLDYRTGGSVSSSGTGVVAVKLFNEIATRPVIACLANGTCNTYVQGSGGGTPKISRVWENDTSSGIARRASWRQLME